MPEPEARATGDAPQRGGFWKFWTSLPGVLTGIAAVIAAVVSLLALFGGPGDGADADAAAPPAPTASPSVAADGPAAPARPTSTSSISGPTTDTGVGQVTAEGRLGLRVNEWADLTAGIVTSSRTAGSEFQLAHLGSYALNPAIAQTFAQSEDGSDRAACVRALQRRRDALLPLQNVREGATICLVTSAENIAALRIIGLPSVGSPRITFDYSVWT